ncbi:sensor domain-containing diguanylate cyclase [Vibrio sp. RE88]|uniref:sensor domain-containing diguanylate cyclase n=1 Tax=Vibrio sp. RE88 TaxID=2607610 RepID=UPI0014938B79|nr:sensor domain-containing diguanylate cyclase [Vibrio sp. RE88]NOH61026.1 sensor domain-containing diguanylate cyclase [Vibrio sp. RE88]
MEKGKWRTAFDLYGYSVATLILVLLIVNFVTYSLYRVQKDNIYDLGVGFARDQNAALINLISKDIRIIGASVHFFYATDSEQWHNFSLFVQSSLKDDIGNVTALQWMPRTQKGSDPNAVPKPEEFVVTEVFPNNESNAKLIGYQPQDARFAHALDIITTTQKAFISDRIHLLQNDIDPADEKNSALVYFPVYSRSDSTNLTGIVIGAIDLNGYFKTLASRLPVKRFEYQIVDQGFDASDAPIVYESEYWSESEGQVYVDSVSVANRSWDIRVTIADQLDYNQMVTLAATFILGHLTAFLVSFLALKQTRDRRRLNAIVAKKTQKLAYMAYHDSLTGVENRRAFNETLKRRVINNEVFTLIGFDVDRFKGINDTFGHSAGDKALQHVVSLINPLLSDADRFYRLGGDEFFMMVEHTDADQVETLLSSITHAIRSTPLLFEDKQIAITLSLGAVIRNSEDVETFINRVDEQIYQSKSGGRNQYSYVNGEQS